MTLYVHGNVVCILYIIILYDTLYKLHYTVALKFTQILNLLKMSISRSYNVMQFIYPKATPTNTPML